MAQTRFDILSGHYSQRALSSGNREQLTRILWTRLMGLYGTLTYALVWTGETLRLEDWRTARFYCPVMPELAALYPKLPLAGITGQESTGVKLAECLHEALWACAEERRSLARAERSYTPSIPTGEVWQSNIQFQRKNLVAQMTQFAATQIRGLSSLLLQGSLADGGVVEGYSDCDVIAILKLPVSKNEFLNQISSVTQLNDFLLAYQPLMHHGPMIYFEEALGWATESTLPSAILAHSVLLTGTVPAVEYVNGDLEAGQAIRMFEGFFDRQFMHAGQIETAFDALWWTSCTSLVPCLDYQLRKRTSIWKRNLLTSLDDDFLKKTTQSRQLLGNWIHSRLADDNWPVRGVLNPGLCLRQHKQTMRLTAAERTAMGITDQLLEEGRRFMCQTAADLSECNQHQLFPDEPLMLGGWPYEVVGRPMPIRLGEYNQLREEWKERALASGKVEAVYEYGAVECPGLSDLDLLFVLRDGIGKEVFSILRLPERQQYLMGHDPQILPLDAVEDFSCIYPMMALRRLLGRDLPLRGAASMPKSTAAVAITAYNYKKYPADLFVLTERLQTDFRTVLAFLHSFIHIRQSLQILGCRIPPSVEKCIEQDRILRAEFLIEGNLLSGELAPAMMLMLDATAGLLFELEQYWLRRLPWLHEVVPVSTEQEISRRIHKARERRDSANSGFSNVLDVISTYLADPKSIPWIESPRVTELLAALSIYRKHKLSYLEKMQRAGLIEDTYIVGQSNAIHANAIGRRYFFEMTCASEPSGKGSNIPSLEWGEVWSFAGSAQGRLLRIAGWSVAEDWGTWTCNGQALLLMRLPAKLTCQLSFEGYAFVTENHRRQTIRVLANGHQVAEWRFVFGVEPPPLNLTISVDLLPEHGDLLLTFECPDSQSPLALGLSADARQLGLALRSMCVRRVRYATS